MLELMFTLALGIILGLSGRMTRFGQSRPWRDYEDLPFIMIFAWLPRLAVMKPSSRSCPSLGAMPSSFVLAA